MKSYLLSFIALLWGTYLHTQQPTPAPAAGQILFSDEPLPPDGYTSAAYIGYETYALTPESRLYLTAFLATSLPNAPARLAPAAQGTDFMKRG